METKRHPKKEAAFEEDSHTREECSGLSCRDFILHSGNTLPRPAIKSLRTRLLKKQKCSVGEMFHEVGL